MRTVMILVLAAGLGAAPAAAQNTTTPETNVDVNATNATEPANEMMAANDVAAMPETVPVTTDTAVPPVTEPAPAPRPTGGGFPWGVIGLVGLVGLLGRKRRD